MILLILYLPSIKKYGSTLPTNYTSTVADTDGRP